MTAQTLRWGLLAPARIGRRIVPAIRASLRGELVAVASRDPQRAQAFAELWDIPEAHGSYEELLRDPGVDVVYVAIPQALHAEWAVKAADAGKHVLVEKPMAINAGQADRIIEASERNKVVILEAMMHRYHPQISRVQELVNEGAIGEVRLIRASFSYPMKFSDDKNVPAILDPKLGGGSLWDLGCYPVSFARAIIGSDPIEVSGMQTTGRTGVDLTFVGGMRYHDGAFAQFDCSFQASRRRQASIIGSEGVIHLNEPWNPQPDSGAVITLSRSENDEPVHFDEEDPFRCEVDALEACVLDDAPSPLALVETRGNIVTLQALQRSSKVGEVVTLPRRSSHE